MHRSLKAGFRPRLLRGHSHRLCFGRRLGGLPVVGLRLDCRFARANEDVSLQYDALQLAVSDGEKGVGSLEGAAGTHDSPGTAVEPNHRSAGELRALRGVVELQLARSADQ